MSIFKKKIPGMLTDKVIRAADFLPEEKPEDEEYNPECYGLPASEKMLYNLFGDSPNYKKRKIDRLWKEFLNADEKDVTAYCLEKGIDIIGNDGKPVPGFRDIAVMLKSIDKGYIKLAKEGGV